MNGTSLFSNVGISELFFKKIGINIKIANELLEDRAAFYKNVYPETNMINGNINDKEIFEEIVKRSIEEKVQFLIATPPCQGMSNAGKKDKDDERNRLIIPVIEFIKRVEPNNILIENVPQMFNSEIIIRNKWTNILSYITKEVTKLGYKIKAEVLDSADYGTPQHRKRAIILISKNDFDFPPKKQKHITVKQAIGNLPSIEAGQNSDIKNHNAKKHNANHIEWMSHTPTGKTAFDNEVHFPKKDNRMIKGFRTTYKRIEWDKPAPTITMANGSISSQNNVHPGRKISKNRYSDARVLTILEIMRLTGIPDNWRIPEWASDNLIRKVVGEGFPPHFAKSMAQTLIKK